MSWDALDLSIFGPALLAGALVLSTHVPLGREVLRRGIIFIDLAVAQTAGLGVIGARLAGFELGGWATQVAALAAALAAALVLTWTESRLARVQEAVIGVLFVLAASAGILLLANDPHGGEQLKDLLVGQVLFVDPAFLPPVAVLYAGVLAAWFGARRRLGRAGFYLLFSLVVTASVQLVGVYLVFASLILPALATVGLSEGRALALGLGLGAAGYLIGFLLSARFDWPTGAIVVWSLGVLAAAAMALRRSGTFRSAVS